MHSSGAILLYGCQFLDSVFGVNPGLFNHAVADPLGKYTSTKWLSIITTKYL